MGARRWSCTAAVVAGLVATAGPAAADGWQWPVDGAGPASVSRPFDPPDVRWGSGHRGVDLASVPATAVRAVGSGTVSYAGVLAGRGVVVVTHGALRTTYEPVAAGVPVGAAVRAGDVVGTLEPGHAGCPAAACLHWGLKRGEEYLDPLTLLGAGPVRLLPLDGLAPAAAGSDRAAAQLPATAPSASAEPRPAGSGPLDLRSATAPASLLGLVALLALLGLRRARPRPPDPASAAAVAPPARQRARGAAPPGADPGDADILDLAAERARRRVA